MSLLEFAGLLTALSSFVVVLYLLDRSRKKQVVSTLRFWISSALPVQTQHRKRIQQPWSLVLQLISIGLLLLAIAQPQWGGGGAKARDHVLILDTSAWMSARGLMTQAKTAALQYVRRLPSSDRVMLVRADALATPVTVFESNHKAVEEAIRQSRPGSSALRLEQAFQFAAQAQRMDGRQAGEVVFAGAGRISSEDKGITTTPANLRLLAVEATFENCGIRKVGLRRSPGSPEVWEALVTVRNYGKRLRNVPLGLFFGGAPVATRQLTLPPGQEVSSSMEFRTKAAGWLEARIDPKDGFGDDDRAVMELPAEKNLQVAVYSADPAPLRPILGASARVEAVYRQPGEYKTDDGAQIVILDRFNPPQAPKKDAVYVEPPAAGSPVAVRFTRQDLKVSRWNSEHPLGEGLRARDLKLASTEIFSAGQGDKVVAESEAGPVVVAREGQGTGPKIVVLGFHPARTALRYELSTPLLFANILRWMQPAIFRRWELTAGSVGTVTVPLESDLDPSAVKVLTEAQKALPFTIHDKVLRFFAAAPGLVRVSAGDREYVYSLSLPEVAETAWEVPKTVRRGLGGMPGSGPVPTDLWRIFAILGGLGLLVDWLVFGRRGVGKMVALGWAKKAERPLRRAS